MSTLILKVFLVLFSAYAECVIIPENPCPHLFKYRKQPSGNYYGILELPNYNSDIYQVELNISMPGLFKNMNIKLELKTPYETIHSTPSIEYYVHFPVQHVLPKVTQILYNNQIICSGPPDPLLPDRGVTLMWAKSTLQTNSLQNKKPSIASYIINQRLPNSLQCGISSKTNSLVINGVQTEPYEFPWLVAIMETKALTYKFRCTGNLISEKHILTAGHCLQPYRSPAINKSNLLVVLGKYNLSNWVNGDAVFRNIKMVNIHPKYKPNTGNCDVAVITLDTPITFTNKINPICLWNEIDDLELLINKSGLVAGWGKDEYNNDYAPTPKKITMPIVSQETCLRFNPAYYDLTSEETFCAGNLDGSGPCTGDSGAGFIMKRNGKWLIRGIVSLALGDATGSCDTSKYFIFSDVAKSTEWIKTIVNG